MQFTLKKISLAIAGAGLLTIYGCGGGGSSSTTTAATTAPVVATPVVTAPTPIVAAGVASLPSTMLALPQAANCAALRSGVFNVINPNPSNTLTDQVGKVTVDAVALTATDSGGVTTFVATSEACHFTGNSGNADIVVSPAGILVIRNGASATTRRLAIGVPAQTATLAEMAGTWNVLGIGLSNGIYSGRALTGTFNSSGVISDVKFCENQTTWDVSNAACVDAGSGTTTFTANADGGFNAVESGAVVGRMFLYTAGSGEAMALQVNTAGRFNVFTRQRTNTLSTVGTKSTTWSLQLDNTLVSPSAISSTVNTTLSVDTAAGSWVRSNTTVGTNDTHNQTLFANNPRNGYTFRPAGSAVAADGTTQTIREVTTLNLAGTGINAVLIPSNKRFQFSVAQP